MPAGPAESQNTPPPPSVTSISAALAALGAYAAVPSADELDRQADETLRRPYSPTTATPLANGRPHGIMIVYATQSSPPSRHNRAAIAAAPHDQPPLRPARPARRDTRRRPGPLDGP